MELDIDELVRRSQEGDKEAFSKIYDLLIDKIYRFVYFKVPESEVDDLVAIAFVKIWTNIRKYEKRDVSFQAWVFRVVKNVVLDHRRFHRSLYPIDMETSDESREANPRELTELAIHSRILKDALKELKESYQQIIIMKFLNDLSNEEIAFTLKKSCSAIRVLQFRALEALRRILANRGIKL